MTKPLEQISAELDSLDTMISNGISQLAEVLRDRLTVRIAIDLGDGRELAFGKHKGDWCFIVTDPNNCQSLLTRPRAERLEMVEAGHLERLVDGAAQQLSEMVPSRRAAIARLESLIERTNERH